MSKGSTSDLMLFSNGRSTMKIPAFLNNKRSKTMLNLEFHCFYMKSENVTGKKVRTICIDKGKELDNRLMEECCNQRGIKIEKVPPYSSAANGMAERANGMVIEGARMLLNGSSLPHSFWGEAAATFCYIDNFVPSARFPDDVPIEIWTCHCHDISHLRLFGCRCWAMLPVRHTDDKLGKQAIEGVLVG